MPSKRSQITIPDSEVTKEARRLAKQSGQTTAFVVRLALQHGLPAAKAKLEALKPDAAPAAR